MASVIGWQRSLNSDRGPAPEINAFQGQQCVATERHDHGLFLGGEDGGMNGLRPHRRIAEMRPLAPLLHRRRADAVPSGQRSHALFTMLYRSRTASVVRALPCKTWTDRRTGF